ncbi:MAG: helix-hairpin-helix domain-containing protein [Verrucomicrobia bacterium]|nr:helix-hairpin-helix domain-containing protein [Prolixibacteraceae bacterium]
MNFKQIVQDYFTFSRNERKGIILLLVIVFLLAIANKVIFYFETPARIDPELLKAEFNLEGSSDNKLMKIGSLFKFNPNTIDQESLDSLSLSGGIKRNLVKFREKGGTYYSAKDFKKIYGVTDSIFRLVEPFLVFEDKASRPVHAKTLSKLFIFDPNTADDTAFHRLGFSEKQIQTIRNYQRKGGSFRKKGDFLRIYGITEAQKTALAEYIVIPEKPESYNRKNEKEIILIEINGTDSIELKRLPGIGNKLSKRIVKYRDVLGGFYTLGQLKEVFGLKEETIHQIETMLVIDSTKIHKIDLNFADWNELAGHPYIRNNLAREIIKFRTRFGNISNPLVLRDSMVLNYNEYERLRPYL